MSKPNSPNPIPPVEVVKNVVAGNSLGPKTSAKGK